MHFALLKISLFSGFLLSGPSGSPIKKPLTSWLPQTCAAPYFFPHLRARPDASRIGFKTFELVSKSVTLLLAYKHYYPEIFKALIESPDILDMLRSHLEGETSHLLSTASFDLEMLIHRLTTDGRNVKELKSLTLKLDALLKSVPISDTLRYAAKLISINGLL